MANTLDKTNVSVGHAIDDLARLFEQRGLVFGHGAVNARDEAAWLVFAVAGIEHAAGSTAYDRLVDPAAWEKIRRLADERVRSRTPLAYLIKEAWFGGQKFYVDERVLVPRSPLAELITAGFEPWLASKKILRVLDIGTGSGCIAVAVALAFPQASVDATDLSRSALDVAALNVERFGLAERVRLLRSDVFEQLPPARYDLIISNPPYVDAAAIEAMPAEYRHEPSLGLAAGTDGLDVVTRILADAHKYLSNHGILVVEVGDSEQRVAAAFRDLPFVWLEMSDGASGIFLLNRSDLPDTAN